MATEIDALYMGINNLATPIEFGAAPVLQEKTVTLTGSQQNITPDQNYDGLSKVVVPGVVGTARSGQVLSGYTFSGANDPTGANGSIVTRSASSETISAAKTYNAGYYPSGWTVTPAGGSLQGTTLWTNPSPTSNFAGQDISLPGATSYPLIGITVRILTSDSTEKESIFWTDGGLVSIFPAGISAYDGYAVRSVRIFTPTAGPFIRFGNAYISAAGSMDNSACIPVSIKGYKVT